MYKKNIHISCSFCGRTAKEAKKLVAGPTVYICDECICLCYQILIEEGDIPDPSKGVEVEVISI